MIVSLMGRTASGLDCKPPYTYVYSTEVYDLFQDLPGPAEVWVLNTFTSFDAPSRDTCGWSMHNLRMRSVVWHSYDG